MADKSPKEDMEAWEEKVQKQYLDWRARRKEVPKLPNLRSFVSTVKIILEICKRFKHAGAGREENRRIALEKQGALRTRAELNLVQESMERLRYFQHINPFQLEALRRVVQYRNLFKGEVLFEEDELCKEYYVVAKGTISMHRKITGESGTDVPEFVTVAKYYEGESFNEGTLSQGQCSRQREMARAVETSSLFVIDRASYGRIMEGMHLERLQGIVSNLRNMTFFRNLVGAEGERALNQLALCVINRDVSAGTIIVQQGHVNDTDFFYGITMGTVRVLRLSNPPKAKMSCPQVHMQRVFKSPFPVCSLSQSSVHAREHILANPHDSFFKVDAPMQPQRFRGSDILNRANRPGASLQSPRSRIHMPVKAALPEEARETVGAPLGFDAVGPRRCHKGPMEQKAVLEIDSLSAGCCLVRGMSEQHQWRSDTSGSIVTLEATSDASFYIINKWDFLRIVSQFDFLGSPMWQAKQQVSRYTNDEALMWEWKEGENWERYKRRVLVSLNPQAMEARADERELVGLPQTNVSACTTVVPFGGLGSPGKGVQHAPLPKADDDPLTVSEPCSRSRAVGAKQTNWKPERGGQSFKKRNRVGGLHQKAVHLQDKLTKKHAKILQAEMQQQGPPSNQNKMVKGVDLLQSAFHVMKSDGIPPLVAPSIPPPTNDRLNGSPPAKPRLPPISLVTSSVATEANSLYQVSVPLPPIVPPFFVGGDGEVKNPSPRLPFLRYAENRNSPSPLSPVHPNHPGTLTSEGSGDPMNSMLQNFEEKDPEEKAIFSGYANERRWKVHGTSLSGPAEEAMPAQ